MRAAPSRRARVVEECLAHCLAHAAQHPEARGWGDAPGSGVLYDAFGVERQVAGCACSRCPAGTTETLRASGRRAAGGMTGRRAAGGGRGSARGPGARDLSPARSRQRDAGTTPRRRARCGDAVTATPRVARRGHAARAANASAPARSGPAKTWMLVVWRCGTKALSIAGALAITQTRAAEDLRSTPDETRSPRTRDADDVPQLADSYRRGHAARCRRASPRPHRVRPRSSAAPDLAHHSVRAPAISSQSARTGHAAARPDGGGHVSDESEHPGHRLAHRLRPLSRLLGGARPQRATSPWRARDRTRSWWWTRRAPEGLACSAAVQDDTALPRTSPRSP